MFSWAAGLGCGLGHSLGVVDSSQTSLTRDICDIDTHVLGKGTFPGEAMDVAHVITSQTEINRRLHETQTLEAEVTHWKMLCPCSTQGADTIDPETGWKLKRHIRDLEQKRMQEMDKHQLEVAVLKNTHRQKLADLTDRHLKQLMDYERQVEDLQNQDAARNVNRDLLEEQEMELRRLKEQLTELQRLNDGLNNLASDLRAEKQKLVGELQDARHQLEESVLRNNEDSLKNNIAVRALKVEKGRLVAKLCQAEKKLFEEKSEPSLREWSPGDNGHFNQHGQEKDREILHLRKTIEQMEADHQETKDLLSFALEEQKQLTECVREQDEYIRELRDRSELQEEFGKSTETFRSQDLLPPSVEDKDLCLPSMTDQHPHGDEDLERLRQQSRAVPPVPPKILEEIEELECEVFQLNRLNDGLQDEIKEQQKIIHNQQEGKRALLQSLQEQKDKVDRLQHRQEEMNTEHAQLLAAKDEMIRNLHVTLEELKAHLPGKSPQIPREPCEDEEVRASQPLPRENGCAERDASKAEIQRLVQGIKDQELEMKLLTEQNIRLSEQVDRLSKEEIGKLVQIIQEKDVQIRHLSSRISAASHSQKRHVGHLQWQLQECALKGEQVLALLNEKTRENTNLKRHYQEMTHRLAAKEADLQRMQEENQKLSTRVQSSRQEVAEALEGKLKSLQELLHQTNADLQRKEDQLQEFKKQNEVQREMLEDTQKKLLTLLSQAEGMVDKTLLRRLFVGSLQAADGERQEAVRLMASSLGIREDQLQRLLGQEPAGVPSGETGGPGSRSAPHAPAKPNPQAVANHSFSGLFVQFLEAESHSAFPPPNPSARDGKPPDSGGRGKLPPKQGPPRLNATLESTPREKDVKPRTTAVALINPPGPEMDGSEHLLLHAVTDALPRYTPHIMSPVKKVGKAANDLSKK